MPRTPTTEAMAIGFYGGKWHIIAEGTFSFCNYKRMLEKASYTQTKTIHYTNKSNYNL